jgi:hypothetical protein
MVQTSAITLQPIPFLSSTQYKEGIRHRVPSGDASTYSESLSQVERQALGAQPTASLSAESNALLKRLLRWNFRIPRPDEVEDYLLRFPEMIEVTGEVARIARERLPEAQLWLEVNHDPEIEDEYLVIDARFPHYHESVLERIEAIENETLTLLQNRGGTPPPWEILLTTDFQNPE